MYYLQSRYYDPEVGRFVNADDVAYLGADGNITSYNLFAYCGNNPLINLDATGKWTFGISLGVNFNLFWGVSLSLGLYVDSNWNIDLQASYAIPGIDDTVSIGVLDAGVGFSFQYTNRESVNDLLGSTTYGGVSVGELYYGGVDVLSFSKPNDLNADIDGIQFTSGVGIGLDSHIVITNTVNVPIRNIVSYFKSNIRRLRDAVVK